LAAVRALMNFVHAPSRGRPSSNCSVNVFVEKRKSKEHRGFLEGAWQQHGFSIWNKTSQLLSRQVN